MYVCVCVHTCLYMKSGVFLGHCPPRMHSWVYPQSLPVAFVSLAILTWGYLVSTFLVLGLLVGHYTHPAFTWVLGIQTLDLIFA